MPALKHPVQLAVIGAAHGIKGEVRVKTFTGDPMALGDYGPLADDQGRRFEIAAIRPAGEVVVVRFKAVADRNAAKALNGTALFVERSALPPAADDEFYHTDLVGLAVRDGETEIGRVKAVHNFGGGDLIEVRLAAGGDVLIPFSLAAVPTVDVAGGYVTIEPLAAGLVDDPDEDGAASRSGERET